MLSTKAELSLKQEDSHQRMHLNFTSQMSSPEQEKGRAESPTNPSRCKTQGSSWLEPARGVKLLISGKRLQPWDSNLSEERESRRAIRVELYLISHRTTPVQTQGDS